MHDGGGSMGGGSFDGGHHGGGSFSGGHHSGHHGGGHSGHQAGTASGGRRHEHRPTVVAGSVVDGHRGRGRAARTSLLSVVVALAILGVVVFIAVEIITSH
ncbi:MAG TPA: hypothetical protein VMU95_13015 [Trebonia sp.]|nr:hypothetical protein [Trebonia sp.]